MNTHPLLEASLLEFGALPFDRIKNEDFGEGLDEALRLARSRIAIIKQRTGGFTFENTIEALDCCSDELDQISGVFSNLLHAHTAPVLQDLAKTVMPKLAEFSNDIHLDPDLFRAVKAVHDQAQSNPDLQHLTQEQRKLLEQTYKGFARNGALLNEEQKGRLREIDKRLAVAGQLYGDHVLKSTQAFELWLTDSNELKGLPAMAVEAAAEAAKEKGKPGQWLVTLDAPSFMPFMRFAEKRELRERLWRAYQSRATNGDTDNRPLVLEIAQLRQKRAQLLGYETHAHFVLEERMAAHPDQVRGFMDRLLMVSRKAAEKDLAELREFAASTDGPKDIQPWDFGFYSEKLQQKKFDFDEEQLRPYFRLEKVVEGVFEHARRLYGLTFKARTDLPVYHPDVQVFEVRGEKNEFVGLFYADFFPRPSKQGGAWMTTFRSQGLNFGKVERPHVSIVCNLTKPTSSQPSLLTMDEVRTVFHEFGHALHALLSDVTFRSLSGTSVFWDFVELPSQIMENWVKEKEGLDVFAQHYQTGEKIPEDFVRKIKESQLFQAGWMSLRQVNFGTLDFAWHATDVSKVTDVEAYEVKMTEKSRIFPAVPGAISSCGFSHIFSGGYSAGYYSYKWAEVLDADAFEFFQEKGIFNREVANRFKENVLSKGGTEHPMDLYKKFRGREPDPDALLRRDGLL